MSRARNVLVSQFIAIVFVVTKFTTTTASAGESTPCHLEKYLNEPLLIALSTAKDTAGLKSAWSAAPAQDRIARAFYSARLVELRPSAAADIGILKSMPASKLEFDLLYAVNDLKAWKSTLEVPRLYFAYFELCARAAARHPDFGTRFLMLGRYAEGDASPCVDDAVDLFHELNPKAFSESIRRLNVGTDLRPESGRHE